MRIDVSLSKHRLNATACNAPVDAKFAFYLFRDDVRIAVRWYTDVCTCSFDLDHPSGIYRILAFIKLTGGEVTQVKSDVIFSNPIEISIDDIGKINEFDKYFKIKVRSWEFPTLYYDGSNDYLFVMLSAAFDRDKYSPPMFNRWIWAKEGVFPGSVMCIADPTIEYDNRITLGWYLGDNGSFVADELTILIEAAARLRGVPNNKIVIWGSSGGGFAALVLASKIADATAVAINPQTNVELYEYRKKFEIIRDIFYSKYSDTELKHIASSRFNTSSIWMNKKNNSRFFLIQNKMDLHHYEIHCKPFFRSLGVTESDGISSLGDNFSWIYTDDKGHIPETKDMVQLILKYICKK